jgi:hypothetical protein
MIEAETCCHLVTLNEINIHNTSCVLTCEYLLLILYTSNRMGINHLKITVIKVTLKCAVTVSTVCPQVEDTKYNRVNNDGRKEVLVLQGHTPRLFC